MKNRSFKTKSNVFQSSVLLLLLILLSLNAACSTTKRGESGRTRVTFWHGMESGVNNRILQSKIDKFNAAHADIYIDAQIYGAADQLGPKLDAAVAGKTPPDVLWWAPAFFPKYAEAGVLRELDDFLVQDKSFDKSDVYDFLWDMGSYRSHVYAAPFSANNLGMYYNKRWFAEAGIANAPATWNEFRQTVKQLTRENRKGFQVPAGSSEWTVWTWQCFLWQAGGEILTEDKKHVAFNSAAGVAALDFWKQLLADGAGLTETDAGYKTDDFLAERVAVTINGPWNYPVLQKQKTVDIGVFPLPREQRAATNIGGESLFLFKSDARTERAAWEFMKYVMSADFQVDWATNTGYLPVSKSATASEKYQAYLAANPFMKTFAEQMNAGHTRPSIPQYPGLSATLGKYLEAAIYSKYSSAEALNRAAAEVDALLDAGERIENKESK